MLPRVEDGGMLPRVDGGGTLTRLAVDGGACIRPCCDWGEGVAGGGPDGGGMEGRKARRAMRGSYPYGLGKHQP